MIRCVDCHITGRVQGVWFRAWTQEQASGRGLSGWVRNAPDGSVRARLAGPADAVENMIAALHDGPPAARVTGVHVTPAAEIPTGPFRLLR